MYTIFVPDFQFEFIRHLICYVYEKKTVFFQYQSGWKIGQKSYQLESLKAYLLWWKM